MNPSISYYWAKLRNNQTGRDSNKASLPLLRKQSNSQSPLRSQTHSNTHTQTRKQRPQITPRSSRLCACVPPSKTETKWHFRQSKKALRARYFRFFDESPIPLLLHRPSPFIAYLLHFLELTHTYRQTQPNRNTPTHTHSFTIGGNTSLTDSGEKCFLFPTERNGSSDTRAEEIYY